MKVLSWVRVGSATLGLLCLLLLLTSGWALMAGYVPSDAEAFSSVVFQRQQTAGGAGLRSIHYHLSSAVVIAAFLYLLTTYLAGRHTRRKTHWWLATGFFLVLLGICFTGYLLPMDQNAYWGTVVRLGIVETIPVAGPAIAGLLRGGPLLNASTLPRFYTLHVAILPVFALLLAMPLVQRAKNSLTRLGPRRRWLALGLGLLFVIYLLARLLPAPLELRADGADSEYIPRPEWYFLWLFQLGKYVEAVPWVQSLILPLLGCGLLIALPFMKRQRAGSRAALAGAWCAGWLALTGLALHEDRDLPAKLPYEEAMRARAEVNYEDLCYECHGEGGHGDGPQSKIFDLDSKDFTTAELWLETSETEMKRSIRDGKGKDMPPFREQLSPEDVDALMDYIRTNFAPPKSNTPA